MELNINIQKLGNLNDIFEFYKYMNANLESKNHVLLESVTDDSRQMLFSFIGVNPDLILEITGENLEIRDVISESGDRFKEMLASKEPDVDEFEMPFEDDVPMNIIALDKLKTIFPITKSALPELFPRKVFSGGLLGYVGYDVVAPYVGYTPSSSSREMFPDALLGFFTTVLAFSHSTKTLYQITNTLGDYTPDPEIANLFLAFKENDGGLRIKIPTFSKPDLLKQETGFESNTDKDHWASMINETKEHLAAGDIIQAVISRKLVNTTTVDPVEVYQALRILNPSAYMFYLNFDGAKGGDIHFIGSSPEALITKSQTTLETVPIAGTRRRGRDAEDEEIMAEELLHSEKELAEHVMLVDLARNDLARVSMPGTVDTYELFKLKKFPNIMHIISKVRATSYKNPFDILKAIFPAGTVSGAPKKRAMEIIHELETEDRGPYAGCVGYVSFAGDMDMAISIRTIFNKNDRFIAQAGAGIVVDSKPDEEFLETENKMKGILSTINLATMIREENS